MIALALVFAARSLARRHAAGPRPHGASFMRQLLRRFERVTAGLRRTSAAWLGRRADTAAFDALDGDALRDLGVARCEIGSFGSEAAGIVERTRRRVVARARPRGPRRPLPEC